MRRPIRQRGFLLMPVVVLLSLVAAAAFVLTLQGSVGTADAVSAHEQRAARLVASAGLAHAAHRGSELGVCSGYALVDEPFGGDRYSVVATPDAGSPVSLVSTGVLKSGVQRSVSRSAVQMYEASLVETLQLGAENTDTYIRQTPAGTNFSAAAFLELERSPVPTHTVLRFDVSGIPPQAVIRSAELALYQESGSGVPGAIDVHEVQRAWTADSATWVDADAATAWTQPGGDYDAAYGARTIADTAAGWVRFEVRALVQEWVAGSQPNRGMLLRIPSGDAYRQLSSSEAADETLRPSLTITYACECASASPQVWFDQPGVAGEDTYVDDGANLQNFGAEDTIRLSNKTNSQKRGLLRFDLSQIPPEAIIQSAELVLNLEGIGSGNTGTVSVYRVTEDWVEGSSTAAGPCWNGASWFERDGACGPWTTAGGSFDPSVRSVSAVDWLSPGPVSFDLRELVQEWVSGDSPNQGMLLQAQFEMNHVDFSTGDHADPALHPQLTVEYHCPCGLACVAPPSFGEELLQVVDDPASLSDQETARRALFESWGFAVSLIDDQASQAAFDTALRATDVVFLGEPIFAANIGRAVSPTRAGVVVEKGSELADLGISSADSWTTTDTVEVIDNGHWITQSFAVDPLVILGSVAPLRRASGAVSGNLRTLATESGLPSLATMEQDAERHDLQGVVDGRRVQLPWGDGGFDIVDLSNDGRTILKRALQWASTSPPPPEGYLDRFEIPVCIPAQDYATSHGALDWSANAWLDELDGDACSGAIRITEIDGSHRLRFEGTGAVQRELDLSSFGIAALRIRHRAEGTLGPSNYLRIEASSDGGFVWNEIGRIDSSGDGTFQASAYSLTGAIAPNTRIRFDGVGLTATRRVLIDDVRVVEASAGPLVCGDEIRDDFDAVSYAGSDGSLPWASDWEEILETDGANSGEVKVKGGPTTNELLVAKTDRGVERAADLSAPFTAELRFDVRIEKFDDADDYVTLDVSTDGGTTWQELDRFEGPADTGGYLPMSYPLDDYLSPNFRLRFLSSSSLDRKDKLHVDELVLCLP